MKASDHTVHPGVHATHPKRALPSFIIYCTFHHTHDASYTLTAFSIVAISVFPFMPLLWYKLEPCLKHVI